MARCQFRKILHYEEKIHNVTFVGSVGNVEMAICTPSVQRHID